MQRLGRALAGVGLPMPVEFTEDETAALIDLLVGTIERYPFRQSLHVQRLRGILEKIRLAPSLPSEAGEETDMPRCRDI